MNEYILKVMRYIDNPKALTKKEMEVNEEAAFDLAFGRDATTGYASVICAAHASRNILTKNQKYAAKYWVSKYFGEVREDRQEYIDEVERLR